MATIETTHTAPLARAANDTPRLRWWQAPKARFRINSTLGQYLRLSGAILTKSFKPDRSNAELEQALCTRLGVPFAVCVNQARVGLYLAFKAVVTPERPKVVLSPYTIYDVVNMVVAAGGEPVFADVDPDNCNISAAEVAKLVDDRTSAVLVTHMHGVAADIMPIRKLCDERGIVLVEDAAQSFGVKYQGRYLGTIGDIGIFSFGLFKTINSFFGGVVVCTDAKIAEQVREGQEGFGFNERGRMIKRLLQGAVFDIASHPLVFRTLTYWPLRYAVLTGNEQMQKLVKSETNPTLKTQLPELYKRRMSGLQARFILDQLKSFDKLHAQRVEIATAYYEALRGVDGIVVPAGHPADGNACLSYPIQMKNRQQVLGELMRAGRDCAPQHVNNCADLEAFSRWHRDCPQARRTAVETIILPTYSRYGIKDAQRNIAVLKSLAAHRH